MYNTMQLRCGRCGARWEYRGRAEVYACCPQCRSKVKIDLEGIPLRLERWAVRVPLEVRVPDDLPGAAEAFYRGRLEPPFGPIAISTAIRHDHSNYDELVIRLEKKAAEEGADPKEVMAAYQILRERFDREICTRLWRSMACRCDRSHLDGGAETPNTPPRERRKAGGADPCRRRSI
jgi:DNA-directed RNA polymerase subunit RPC12/RpoP